MKDYFASHPLTIGGKKYDVKIIVKDAASDWLYLYPQIVVAKTDVTGYPVNGLNSQFYAYDIVKKG